RWLRNYEGHIAIVNILPYTEVMKGFTYTQRMNAEMFSALALLGLVLAAMGIFGVTALTVARKTREMGIRMALGAEKGHVAGLIMRPVLVAVGVGLVAGHATYFLLAASVEGLLYGVEVADPWNLVITTGVLAAAAVAATAVPALRVTSMDPMSALRVE
ncbi:MAG: FtsX-like permease family protein, partial [Gemmatimonadota bacterium]|nr:FtsX-like permease family protein [Gemmatimonadota bacterium]